MRRNVLIAMLLGLTTLASGCLRAPTSWSPDGRWLAYTMSVRTVDPLPPPGWLFDGLDAAAVRRTPAIVKPSDTERYQIWASQLETGESVKLAESRAPLTSPSWSPSGRALAFGRIVTDSDQHGRFEIVVMDGLDHERILYSRPHGEFHPRAFDLPGLSFAWSPDGRYLAGPIFQQGLDLAVIRADNGRVMKVVENAYLPSWSPDGLKLAYIRGGDNEELELLDSTFSAARSLTEVGQTTQSPVWFRDGRSLLVMIRQGPRRDREPAMRQVDLVRVPIDGGRPEKLANLASEQVDASSTFNGASFTIDKSGEQVFYASDFESNQSVITWIRPRNHEVHKKFHPLDPVVRIGSLAVSPEAGRLAMRLGGADGLALAAICDLETERLTPLVPDDAARLQWLALLLRAAEDLIASSMPPAHRDGRAIARPTRLPVPGEMPDNNQLLLRLGHLARIGKLVLERPATAPAADAQLAARLAEATLFFDYLSRDYPSAMRSLEAFGPLARNAEQRVKLLTIRAQILLGLRRVDEARDVIAYLREVTGGNRGMIELTAEGPVLTPNPNDPADWPSYLAEQAVAVAERNPRTEFDANPFGNANPDAVEIEPAQNLLPFGLELNEPPPVRRPRQPGRPRL